MANTIQLTEADYKAINAFLAATAEEKANWGDSGSFSADDDEITLENGLSLYLVGTFEADTFCTYKGDYYQPAEYRTDISLNIKDVCAFDADGEEHPVAFDWRKVTTDFSFD